MDLNTVGTVVSLQDKLLQLDRKKAQSDANKVHSGGNPSSSSDKKYISDVIGIRNENKLAAASSGSVMSKDEAMEMLDELKSQFMSDSGAALDAHNKTDANAVMQYYPFE